MKIDPIQAYCISTGAPMQDVMTSFGCGMVTNSLNADGERLVYGTSFGGGEPNSIMAGGNTNGAFSGYNLGKTSSSMSFGGGYNLAKTSGMSFGGGFNLSNSTSIFVPVGTLSIYNQSYTDPNSNPNKIDLSSATASIYNGNVSASSGSTTSSDKTQTQDGGKKYSYHLRADGTVDYTRPDGTVATVREVQRYDVATYNEAQKALKARKSS